MYVTNSELSYSSSSLPNNSIILADTGYVSYSSRTRMGFYCCSNHTTYRTGTFIGLNGNAYSGGIRIDRYHFAHSYAGCMYLSLTKQYYSSQNTLGTSEQGIYTCRMPDATGRNIDVSVGIYREGYSGKSNPCNYSIITPC